MKLIFFLLFFPYIIFAQNFKTEGLRRNNEQKLDCQQTRNSFFENRKVKIGFGVGKYNVNSINMVIRDQNNGNIFYTSLSTPINNHFSAGYIFQFMRQVSKSEMESDFVSDVVYSNLLNIECSLFGSQHNFDLGASAAYGFSFGSYVHPLSNQIVSLREFMPLFKIFGVVRLNKKIQVTDFMHNKNKDLNRFWKFTKYFKSTEISLGPQIATQNSNGRTRNIWTISLNTNLDF